MKMTRGEMQDLLSKFSTDNADYRAALIKDPKGVISEQFQMELPDNVSVEVCQESADKVYVVIPHIVEEGAELDDADLEAVAGGGTVKGDANCSDAIASTVVEINASLF